LLVTACRLPPAQAQARAGDFVALRATLATPESRKTDVGRLAREVLAYEIKSSDNIDDRSFIASLRPCAVKIDGPLLERSKTRDAVGGEAALLLYEIGEYRGPAPKRFQSSPEGAFRALAARATKDDHAQRVAYFVDDDERVRQAALEAAVEAKDERDLPALLEASRLDPSPYIRSRALYALGQLGGARVHHALVDRLVTPNADLQLAVLDALAQPGVAAVDDYAALVHASESREGTLALHAAYLLSQLAARPKTVPQQGTLAATGTARLLAFAEQGSEEERRLALRLLPASAQETESLLLTAAKDPNPEVRVLAWARLLGRDKHRAAAEGALLELAKGSHRVAYQARSALAAGGSLAVLPHFEEQAAAPQVELRRLAGQAFIRLGRDQELAPLLADPSESVRRTLACGRIAAERY
jgi:HEAT repeat protein